MTEVINYGFYLIAFIDILGQKEEFKEKGRYLDEIPEYLINREKINQKLLEAHKQTIDVIEFLRKGFDNIRAEIKRPENSKVKVPADKVELYNKMRKSDLKIYPFSDSFIVHTSLTQRDGRLASNVINGVFHVLFACGTMFALALSFKKPLRAGIEVGLGTELSNNEIYGPVLYRAYEQESNVAKFPRIVVGQGLLNYLKSIERETKPAQGQAKEDFDYFKKTAAICNEMIIKDSDGVLILDYLGKIFIDILRNNPETEYKKIFNNAFTFIEQEYCKFKESKNEKLEPRYAMLLEYFKSRKKYYSD